MHTSALHAAPAAARCRFALSKKRSTDIVGGELSLGFEVMDAVTYALVSAHDRTAAQQQCRGSCRTSHRMHGCCPLHQVCADVEAEADADHIASSFAGKALRVQLKGINGLRASGLLTSRVAPKGLSLLIKVGRCLVEKPLPQLGAE